MVNMKAVEDIRESLGIPKTKLAEKCGVSVGTYDNWLKRPTTISSTGAKALAEALLITEPERVLAIFFAPNVQENLSA